MKSERMKESIAKREADAITAFRRWYQQQGWNEAVEGAPWSEGRYLGTRDAESLLPDFLEANSKYVFYEEALRNHCYELGEMFNPDQWHFSEEADEDDSEEVIASRKKREVQQFVSDLYRIHKVRQRFRK